MYQEEIQCYHINWNLQATALSDVCLIPLKPCTSLENIGTKCLVSFLRNEGNYVEEITIFKGFPIK